MGLDGELGQTSSWRGMERTLFRSCLLGQFQRYFSRSQDGTHFRPSVVCCWKRGEEKRGQGRIISKVSFLTSM